MAAAVGQIALAYALSYIANKLLAPKSRSPLQDETPATLSTRGSFVPWMLGRKRVGPIFCYAGRRFIKKEKSGGGKGAPSAPDQRIVYQSGWHVLACNGPAQRLFRILQSGSTIFEGPIDSSTHPSGSEVSCGKEGTFKIYWGEADQPINSEYGTDNGIFSKWPYLVSIYWIEKRLGTSPQWQLLDYELEIHPFEPALALSQPWIEATRSLTASPRAITGVQNGATGTCFFAIQGNHTSEFKNGGYLKLSGNGANNVDYLILKSTYTRYTGIPPNQIEIDTTYVYLEQVLAGATVAGTIQAYSIDENDGVNPAHMIYQLAFQEFPHGIGLDRDLFDLDSLENLGVTLQTERIPMTVYAQDGNNASAILASVLQDVGAMISWDNGKFRFKMIRKVDPNLIPILTSDSLVSDTPEVDNNLSVRPADRVAYIFSDRSRGFRDMPITIDDDGQSSIELIPRARKVPIITVTDFDTGTKIAERRSQEDLAGASKTKISANRQTRLMFPGQAFLMANSEHVWRLITKKPLSNSSLVELEAIIDYYGQDISSFRLANGGGLESPVDSVERDALFTFVEVPAYLSAGKQTIIVPRIRDNSQIIGADLWISRDNISYEQKAFEYDVQTGGFLVDSIPLNGPTLIENGPVFRPVGPDIGTILDLSGDIINWRAGRQIVIIDNEIFFLRNITAIGGGLYRMNGLLRARFDTDKELHPINSGVFIFENGSITNIQDILLEPGVPLYVKSQPFTTESYALSQITPIQKTLIGKGVVPIKPANLRTQNLSNSYRSGESIAFKWTYRSNELARSGAGMQGAGAPVGKSSIQGEFMVRIKTIGGSNKRDITAGKNLAVTYQNSDLVFDFGFNPASFKAELFNVSGGYSSPGIEITVTRSN